MSGGGAFLDEVAGVSRQPLDACYQCLKCTVGCPTAPWMDIKPNAVIRHLQLGQEDRVLSSHALWLCVACGTCGTRCPNGIDIGVLFDALREVAVARKIHPAERVIHVLHEAFVDSIGRGGRVHEATMLVDHKLRSRDFLTDIIPGMRLFLKGKIPILPTNVRDRAAIRQIFKRCGR